MAGINLVGQLRKPRGTSAGFEESAVAGGSLFEKLRTSLKFGRSDDGADVPVDDAGGEGGLNAEDRGYLLKFILGVALIFGGRMAMENYTGRIQAELQAKLTDAQQKVAVENTKLAGLQNVKAELDEFEKQMTELRRKLELIRGVSRNRNLIVRAVDYAITEMPESLWLEDVNMVLGNDNRVEIFGYALTNQIISEYVKRLEGGAFFPTWNLVETMSSEADARPRPGSAVVVAPTSTGATGATTSSSSNPKIEAKKFSINAKVVPL